MIGRFIFSKISEILARKHSNSKNKELYNCKILITNLMKNAYICKTKLKRKIYQLSKLNNNLK